MCLKDDKGTLNHPLLLLVCAVFSMIYVWYVIFMHLLYQMRSFRLYPSICSERGAGGSTEICFKKQSGWQDGYGLLVKVIIEQ